ncbi:hypothetical protein C8Q78DRAFT_13630 [Trametes maxima]|nr:hypothetical protein C8Q78DRAFT_13630 [Trametes maxima]
MPGFGSDMTPEWRTHFVQNPPAGPSSLSPSPSSSSSPASRAHAMAAVAASSSSTRTPQVLRAQRSRKPDVFKPRFPLDPFLGASAPALGEPWFLKVDALLAATAHQRRNVIFVLGAPSLKELAPLFQSRHLAKSLVILATHNPPDIPHIVLPTVRILHLSAPLALEDAGAVRFVNVLEWAERIARSWRKHGGTGVLELSEELDIHGGLAPPSVLRFNGSQSTPASPGSSSTQLSSESLPSRPSSIFRPRSSSSGSFLPRSRQASQTLPPPDPSQRPFDVLINFLPDHVSDKALLKNSILVTTISRPFLVSNGPAPPAVRSRSASSSSSSRFLRPTSMFGAFSRSSSSVYLPPTPPYHSGDSLNLPPQPPPPPPPPAKALLIHLLPPTPAASAPAGARRKLVESIESFLVSFAFQPAGAATGGETAPLERARPYVMQAATFCDAVRCEPGVADWGDWTVADVVLSAALNAAAGLDHPAGGSAGAGGKGKTRAMTKSISRASARRALIASAADLVIMPSADGASSSSSHPPHHSSADTEQPSSFSPARALDRSTRSASAPTMGWGPGSGSGSGSGSGPGTTAPPQMTHSHSTPVSRQRSPIAKEVDVRAAPEHEHEHEPEPEHGIRGRGGSGSGYPTPPRSEESSEGGSSVLEASMSSAERSVGSSSFTGASSREGRDEKSARKHGWRFWRRLSHFPAPMSMRA